MQICMYVGLGMYVCNYTGCRPFWWVDTILYHIKIVQAPDGTTISSCLLLAKSAHRYKINFEALAEASIQRRVHQLLT